MILSAYHNALIIIVSALTCCTKPDAGINDKKITVDLSSEETANCYVVDKAGYFKFRTVKGNSSDQISPSTAEVLWESVNSTDAPAAGSIVSDVSYSDGYVTFRASGKAGNALLAVKDNMGNILWSWHIWKPETEITSARYSTMSSGGMMDRNLGALTAEPENPLSNGYIYQWGRKDPFPGAAENTDQNKGMATNGTEDAGTAFIRSLTSSTKGTIEYSIQHPTEYLYCDSGTNANSDWLWERNDALWSRTQKTKYDPCPPGYRVADYGSWGTDNTVPVTPGTTGVMVDNKHWYPFSGVRWNSNGGLHGCSSQFGIWTGWAFVKDCKSVSLFYSLGNDLKSQKDNVRSYGNSVRCLTDKTPAHPALSQYKDISENETANCYVVYSAGLYRFRPMKGNSDECVIPDSVEAIWETTNTATAPKTGAIVREVEYVDGYILFSASSTPGSALIAARDSDGKILWSWHIWKPSTRIHTTKYSTMSGGGIMDRNLGALTAAENDPQSCGFLYQWGRKDPFPGPAEHSMTGAEIATNGTEEGGGKFKRVEFDAGIMDVRYSTEHPAEFIYSDSKDADWTNLKDDNLWGRTQKTKYDPCPPGYRVMDSGVFKDIPYEVRANGLVIDNIHWYPFNGVRWNSNGSLHGVTNIASVWTAYGYLSSYMAEYLYYYNNSFNPSASAYRAYGNPVRCFTEKTPAPERNDRKFFDNLPAGTMVTGVEKTASGYAVSCSDGSSINLDRDKSGLVTVSEDGYWEINGVKSSYKHVGADYMHVGYDGHWYKNALKTSEVAFTTDATAGEYDVVLTGMVEKARKATFLFSDGSSVELDKKQDFGMFVKKTQKDELVIYMGLNNSGKWVRYRFYYRNSDGYHEGRYPDNYDNWGIGAPMTATKTGASSFTDNTNEIIFLDGESEAAVQTNDNKTGAKTYSGGVLHGYELMCADKGRRLITFKIDGAEITEDALLGLKPVKRIEIEQQTKIARAYTEDVFANAFATVTKTWVFENGKVNITVKYDMLQDINIYLAKFGMFCVKRRLEGRGQGVYVTNLAWKDSVPFTFYDLSDGWEDRISLNTKDPKAGRVEEYGDFGMSFAMVFDRDKPNTLKSGGGFDLRTNGNNYNKIYFDICGSYEATKGESLYSTIHWEIDYISDYKKF